MRTILFFDAHIIQCGDAAGWGFEGLNQRCPNAGEPNLERDFQYAFYLIMKMLSGGLVVAEKQTSEGRVDCVVETDKYVYIFEFRRDGTAAEALAQIEEKGYAREYEADERKLYKIGCSFSTETGTISDWASVP